MGSLSVVLITVAAATTTLSQSSGVIYRVYVLDKYVASDHNPSQGWKIGFWTETPTKATCQIHAMTSIRIKYSHAKA